MQEPIQGDQAQHVAVPQRSSPQRQGDLGPLGEMLASRRSRRWQHNPGIAAHAAIPAKPIPQFPHEQAINRSDLGHVGTDQLMAAQPATDQLVMKPRPQPLRPLSPRCSLATPHLLVPLHQLSPPSSQTRPHTSCPKLTERSQQSLLPPLVVLDPDQALPNCSSCTTWASGMRCRQPCRSRSGVACRGPTGPRHSQATGRTWVGMPSSSRRNSSR